MRAIQLGYQQFLRLANAAMARGVPANLAGITQLLVDDLNNSVPVNQSQAVRDLNLYLARQEEILRRNDETRNPRLAELPIDTSRAIGDVPEQALRNINPGSSDEHRNIGPLRNVVRIPLDRPPSPGPTHPIYWIPWNSRDEDIEIPVRFSRLDQSHPEYVNRGLLQRNPFANHPSGDGTSQLSTIPYFRIWENGDMLEDPAPCETERQFFGPCGKPTRSAVSITELFSFILVSFEATAS